jgi:hypothetical protein
MIPTLLIMTSNAPDTLYLDVMNRYRDTLNRFIGPTETLVSGETQQVKDYSKFDWTMFDAEQRYERRKKVFPDELRKAFEKGSSLASRS